MVNEKENKKGIKEKILGCLHHKFSQKIVLVLIIIVILGFAFLLGVKVGEIKASYSYNWLSNYHRNFAGPNTGFFRGGPMMFGPKFFESHGNFGEIIDIQDQELVIKDLKNNIEKVVIISPNTLIKKGFNDLIFNNLKIGDQVVIIGSPNNQGQIEAKFIRVF
ncbi:MAG: hypothetical protein ACPL3E_01610 [Minisyncoccia bacterium]